MAKQKSEDPLDITGIEEIILHSIRDRERYGLEIIEAISKTSNGKRKIGFSSLYPTLKRLEERGFVASRWGGELPQELEGARRRYYLITELGALAIVEKQAFLERLSA